MLHELELIDHIRGFERGRQIDCIKQIPTESPLFKNHFPNNPVVPGVMLVEAMAQAGGLLIMQTLDMKKMALMVLVRRAKFNQFVRPGEVAAVSATLKQLQETSAVVDAWVRVSGQQRVQAQIVFRICEFPSQQTQEFLCAKVAANG